MHKKVAWNFEVLHFLCLLCESLKTLRVETVGFNGWLLGSMMDNKDTVLRTKLIVQTCYGRLSWQQIVFERVHEWRAYDWANTEDFNLQRGRTSTGRRRLDVLWRPQNQRPGKYWHEGFPRERRCGEALTCKKIHQSRAGRDLRGCFCA